MANLTEFTLMGFCCDDILDELSEKIRVATAELGEEITLTKLDAHARYVYCWQSRCVGREVVEKVIEIFRGAEAWMVESLMLVVYDEGSAESLGGVYTIHYDGDFYVRSKNSERDTLDSEPPEGWDRLVPDGMIRN